MRKIENIKDLRSERARLKLELNVAEEILMEDVEWVKAELKPVHLAGKYLSNTLINKDKGIVNYGIRQALDGVLKGGLLSNSNWIIKTIIPYIIGNISSNYVNEKKPEFFGMLKKLISKARKTTHDSHNHFDKSTVDEMNY